MKLVAWLAGKLKVWPITNAALGFKVLHYRHKVSLKSSVFCKNKTQTKETKNQQEHNI